MKLNSTSLVDNGVTSVFRLSRLSLVGVVIEGVLGGGTLTLQRCSTKAGTFKNYASQGTPVTLDGSTSGIDDGFSLHLPGGQDNFWRFKLTGATTPTVTFVFIDPEMSCTIEVAV